MPKSNRFKTFDFWDGAVFGVTATSITAVMIAWLLSGRSFDDQRVLVTLIVIPVAFLGAFVSLSVVRYQVNNSRTQGHKDTRSGIRTGGSTLGAS
jgi:4-hydroxybenzoate polyprenyltransferase